MSYADSYIRYEHKFLRNIHSKEETSKELKSLETYEIFDRFLTIVILLESSSTNRGSFNETSKEKLSSVIEENCAGAENYHEITEQIKEIEIKNLDPKIPKFSQQPYAFVYVRLIEFPRSNIEYETTTTANFLKSVYRIAVKIHLHHSHTTGEIFGYVDNFCNGELEKIKQNFLSQLTIFLDLICRYVFLYTRV